MRSSATPLSVNPCSTLVLPTALLTLMLLLMSGGVAGAVPVQWTVESGGNGHFYDFLGNQLAGNPNTYSWDGARVDAESRGGYLATPTSAAEWAFMQSQMYDWVGPVDPVYSTCGACGNRSYQGWLGGFQNTSSPSYSEPGGGWEWVTGEPWSFTAWHGGEPNNSGGEDHIMTWFHNAGGWNDHVPTNIRYFIEYNTNPIPEPSTALLIGLGLSALAVRRENR